MTLYIGCRPSTPCQEFSAIGAIVGATIEAEKGVPYRLIEGLYGGNAALFAKTVGEYLDLNPQEALVVDLASEMARDALDALIARAAVIVRGF
jgi:urea transporter